MLRYLKGKVATECGHKTERSGEIKIETSQGLKVINIYTKKSEIPCCIKCFEEGVIRCAKCGEPIFPGNPITLHKFSNTKDIPEYAVNHEDKDDLYISCFRFKCIGTISEMAGYLSHLDSKKITRNYRKIHFKSKDNIFKIF